MNILIVEDEVNLGETLKEYLKMKGYQCVWVSSCDQALTQYKVQNFDLCILDIGLPDGNGLELAKQLKTGNQETLFLFLSAQNDPEMRVQGLELGAEDYITKPFDLRELSLRLKKILANKKKNTHVPDELHIGKLSIWFPRYQVQDAHSKLISLNQKECAILRLLYENKNEVVSRDQIIDKIWGEDSYPSHRTVDNYIVGLRKWSETDPNSVEISTVRGIGYRMDIKG